jgi:hypothetical protein
MATGDALLEALARGREDHQFFSRTFLKRELHDGQLEYVENANATINVLATSNRWGKTTVLSHVHFHGCIYKTGGEPRYLDPVTGAINQEAFLKLRYNTIHTADDFETARLVWDEATKIIGESPELQAFIKDAPKSLPPHITFLHGSKWKFRTLGHDASGIDGNSFYIISIDEAGWITGLEVMMGNVIRVRVADVRGVIHLVGTMKPGISRDFYKYSVRASAYTGAGLSLDHRTNEDDAEVTSETLDASVTRYVREHFEKWTRRGHRIDDDLAAELARLGISADEFTDAIGGR